MLNKEQFEKLLEDNLPSIMEGLKEELQSTVKFELTRVLSSELEEYTKQWVKENIIPEVGKQLVESKDVLMKSVVNGCSQIADMIIEGMVKQAKDNLQSSWDRKKIFKALFGE